MIATVPATAVWRDALQATIEIRLLVRLLALPPRPRLLELGCGGGNALEPLQEQLQAARLAGIDRDVSLLAAARSRLQQHRAVALLVQGDVRCLPFAAGSFDLVIDFGTLYRVPDETRREALAEVARVLSAGGCFVYEKRFAQRLAHPLRYSGEQIPWESCPELTLDRNAIVWASRRKPAVPGLSAR